jgi:NAD(P) transhydrogenase
VTRWDGVSQVRTEFSDGRHVIADKVLVAARPPRQRRRAEARRPAGIALTSSGYIAGRRELMTTVPAIYAPATSSAALARVGVHGTGHAARRPRARAAGAVGSRVALPSGVYTIPEIATVGSTSTARAGISAARSSGARNSRRSRAGRSMAASAACSSSIADPGGGAWSACRSPAKAHRARAHRPARAGAELEVDAYVDNVFNFPTMAEAYRIARSTSPCSARAGGQ